MDFYDAITNREVMRKAAQHFKRLVDGEEVGKDPLVDIPEPMTTLYGLVDIFVSQFFETLEELKSFLKEHNGELEEYYILEYLGDMAGRDDVIRITYKSDHGERVQYYAPTSTEHYGVYNHQRSIYCGKHIWEVQDGNYLKEFFDALKEHGLEMKNDYWAKETALIESMREYARERGIISY